MSIWNVESTLNHLHNLIEHMLKRTWNHSWCRRRKKGGSRQNKASSLWAGNMRENLCRGRADPHTWSSKPITWARLLPNAFLNFPFLMYWCLSSNYFSRSNDSNQSADILRVSKLLQKWNTFKNAFIFKVNLLFNEKHCPQMITFNTFLGIYLPPFVHRNSLGEE